jgi:hypothetical protein
MEYMRTRREDKAKKLFSKYLMQEPEPNNPSLAHAQWRSGQALEKQGRKPEAISVEETALVKPDLKLALEDLKRMKK